MATAVPPSANLERDRWKGIKPLRAGEGLSFLLRRLHSLSGIVPVGAFLVEHFVSNAYATNGPHAYATQIKFLNSLPFVFIHEELSFFTSFMSELSAMFFDWEISKWT